MLNEERVRHMTHMAMFEEKEYRQIAPALEYNKKDYVNLAAVWHFILGTVVYWLAYVFVISTAFSFVGVEIHVAVVVLIIVAGVLLYAFYIYAHLLRVCNEARHRYDEGVQKLRKLRRDYKLLEEMYEREEQLKEPEGWD